MCEKYCNKTHTHQHIEGITHCIFDLDGTLIDTESVNTQLYDEMLREQGHRHSPQLRQKMMGCTLVESWKIIIKELNLTTPLDTLVEDFRKRSYDPIGNCALLPGAEKLLLHLSHNKIPLAIATSSAEDMYMRKQSRHKKIFAVFDHVVCGGTDPEVKHSKPEPDIYLICAARFPDNPCPSNCLVFEDAPNGINAAFHAGMSCVAIPDKDIPKEACRHAVSILNSLEEFKPENFGLPPYKKK